MYMRQRSPHMAGLGYNQKQRLGGRIDSTTLAALCGGTADFTAAMVADGIVPADPQDVIADGRLHRFRIIDDRPGSRNGWAVLHLDGIPAGAYGHWKTGRSGTWRSGRVPLTHAQQAAFAEQVRQARREREHERLQEQRAAQERARHLWAQGAAALASHPYLARKCCEAHGIRQLDMLLLVPMRDANGELWNVQTISPDGNKRFLHGGRTLGLYHAIGQPGEDIMVAEGYATAASLHEAAWKPVAVAFSCGNLVHVSRALHMKLPHATITVCADNDIKTPGNPGLTAARAAAEAVGGKVVVPPEPYIDFNDAAVAEVSR